MLELQSYKMYHALIVTLNCLALIRPTQHISQTLWQLQSKSIQHETNKLPKPYLLPTSFCLSDIKSMFANLRNQHSASDNWTTKRWSRFPEDRVNCAGGWIIIRVMYSWRRCTSAKEWIEACWHYHHFAISPPFWQDLTAWQTSSALSATPAFARYSILLPLMVLDLILSVFVFELATSNQMICASRNCSHRYGSPPTYNS